MPHTAPNTSYTAVLPTTYNVDIVIFLSQARKENLGEDSVNFIKQWRRLITKAGPPHRSLQSAGAFSASLLPRDKSILLSIRATLSTLFRGYVFALVS